MSKVAVSRATRRSRSALGGVSQMTVSRSIIGRSSARKLSERMLELTYPYTPRD
jgi:hypothetical protein